MDDKTEAEKLDEMIKIILLISYKARTSIQFFICLSSVPHLLRIILSEYSKNDNFPKSFICQELYIMLSSRDQAQRVSEPLDIYANLRTCTFGNL
jgi:hypothetical protein